MIVAATQPRNGFKTLCRAFVVALGACLLSGCDRATDQQVSKEEALYRPVTRTAEADDVKLTFLVSPGDLPYTQTATIVITVDANPGKTVTIENYASILRAGDHQFELDAKQTDKKSAVLQEDGRLRWWLRYELEFVLPGEYELPGATITYLPVQPDPDTSTNTSAPEEKTLSTESITVIAEATSETALTPEELAQIETLPPVEMHEKRSLWAWFVPLLVMVVLIGLFLWIRRRRANRPIEIVVIPAHQWAHERLAKLVSENLLDRGLIQEFHYRISDILRGYIERRYGLLAREMTTEEFLEASSSDERFDAGAREGLDRFLRACDLVKYARQSATPADGDALLETTRAFVERTRERYVKLGEEGDQNKSGERAA